MVAKTIVTRMALVMLASLLAYAPGASARSSFAVCDQALKKKAFSRLSEYYARHPDEPRPDMCFRFDRDRFLVTVTDTNRASQGLYYVDTRKNKPELNDGRYLPNIAVEAEFSDRNGGRYVLLSWWDVSKRHRERGFDLLNLNSGTAGKPYSEYNLFHAGEDSETGLCGVSTSTGRHGKTETFQAITEGRTESVNDFRISGDGTAKPQIVFILTEQDCRTLRIKPYSRTYRLLGGMFKEVKPEPGG